jgi:anion-transporting  ArsA/GET3 family ATPase
MINELVKKRKIVVTCGTGGVGKTTLSAALALRAAMLGKKAIVITIDPAKRLATSLGLSELGNTPTDITQKLVEAIGKTNTHNKEVKGSVSALMPDTRKTFEDFVHSLATNPAQAERVIRNPIFQIFAKEFSGSNEYMALEKLYQVYLTDQYDFIVLDTPPSANTLDFLEAPKLLTRFFEERLIRWLVMPTNKILSVGMKKAFGLLEKLTGAGFMNHLLEFASALFDVRVHFTQNLKKITYLLGSEHTAFLVVAAPSPDLVPEVIKFIEVLDDHRFQFEGLILNRTLSYLNTENAPSPEYERAYQVIRGLQNREMKVLNELEKKKITPLAKLPELARDVHSIEDLFHVAMEIPV